MKVKYNVNVPKVYREYGEVSKAIMAFIESDNANLKFECENAKEAASIYSSARTATAPGKIPAKVMRRGNDIYVLRKGDK